jgi:hypothetical protein
MIARLSTRFPWQIMWATAQLGRRSRPVEAAPAREEHRLSPGKVRAHFPKEVAKLRTECLPLGAAVSMYERVLVAHWRAAPPGQRLRFDVTRTGIVRFVRPRIVFFATRADGGDCRNRIVPFVRRKHFFCRSETAQNGITLNRAGFARGQAVPPMPKRIAIPARRTAPPFHRAIRRRLFHCSLNYHHHPASICTMDSCTHSHKSHAAICRIFPCFAVLCSVLQRFSVHRRVDTVQLAWLADQNHLRISRLAETAL